MDLADVLVNGTVDFEDVLALATQALEGRQTAVCDEWHARDSCFASGSVAGAGAQRPPGYADSGARAQFPAFRSGWQPSASAISASSVSSVCAAVARAASST